LQAIVILDKPFMLLNMNVYLSISTLEMPRKNAQKTAGLATDPSVTCLSMPVSLPPDCSREIIAPGHEACETHSHRVWCR
jgi:hypothetical protein